MRILVTGGAGFIGSHLVDGLIEGGHEVRVFDNLDPQVHGESKRIPDYLTKKIEFIPGDMRDYEALKRALKDVEVVFHLAAIVGVGQSMYQIQRYTEVNTLGTAILLNILANEKHRVRKMIIASSMSVYGEGAYLCPECGPVHPKLRTREQLKERDWEMRCPRCGKIVQPLPTDEEKLLSPASIYAISKRDQEEMSLNIGRAYSIPTVVLRYFNTYGPRQALSNPYTGAAAIFSSRILNNHPPLIFEDGQQKRDFIHVRDVVQASLLAMKKDEANYEIFNVATGRPLTILDLANILIKRLGSHLRPQVVNRYREGDIRHCYADISKIERRLGFVPQVKFKEGIEDLISWVGREEAVDLVEEAKKDLEKKGLIE